MSMEEMLKQILEGQNEMKADIKDLQQKVDVLQQNVDVLQQNVDILMANSNRTGEYVEYLSKELIAADIIHEHY